MKRSVFLAVLLAVPAIAVPATIYVPDNYPTIQEAIDAAVLGDTVIVRPGTYVERIRFKGKSIVVKSEMGPLVTIIDGDQAGSVVDFIDGENKYTVLEGFTITNGSSSFAGGILCSESFPVIAKNIITENVASMGGGGIECTANSLGISPTIENNIIARNHGSAAGGIYAWICSPSITNNVITENSSYSNGGGLNLDRCNSLIVNNTITGNTALEEGGGIFCEESSLTIANNIVARNHSYERGGGLYSYLSDLTLRNATITQNTATGYSEGGAIYCIHSTVSVANAILWDNFASLGPELYVGSSVYPSTLTISHSDVQGGQSAIYVDPGSTLNWGAGMIDIDPLFVEPASGDFHLTWGSPCIQAGTNAAVPPAIAIDFEGDPRIAGSRVDMGADEFHAHLYYLGDAVPGGSIDLRIIGLPGTGATLGLGSGVLDPPQSTSYGLLYLDRPIWRLDLGSIGSTGVVSKRVTVPTNLIPGEVYPCQALTGSVLTNLMLVEVE